jgi:hypothetical protein
MAVEMYEIEIRHDGLKKFRVIRGRDRYVVEEKARMQCATWDEQWERKVERHEASALKEERSALRGNALGPRRMPSRQSVIPSPTLFQSTMPSDGTI